MTRPEACPLARRTPLRDAGAVGLTALLAPRGPRTIDIKVTKGYVVQV